MNLGLLIKKFRIKKGLTQENLGKKTNLSKSYISQIEKSIKTPRVEQIQLISKALDVPISTLFFNLIEKENVKTDKETIEKEINTLIKSISNIFEVEITEKTITNKKNK